MEVIVEFNAIDAMKLYYIILSY